MKPILVVDDEAIVRESIRDWLREAGYLAEMVETGEEALDLISRKDFSIMVLDYRLPGQSGVDVLREVKKTKPQIKCIMITAFPSAKLTAELAQVGGLDDFLIKPVMMEQLENIIKEKLADIEAEQPARRPGAS